MFEREEHSQKAYAPSSSTEDGMQIDERAEHLENAQPEIRDSLELDSNVTVERDSH
jgi:hypothetical protein